MWKAYAKSGFFDPDAKVRDYTPERRELFLHASAGKDTPPAGMDAVGTAYVHLEEMMKLGLGCLSLDRATSTLFGGEAQRIKMVRRLGSALRLKLAEGSYRWQPRLRIEQGARKLAAGGASAWVGRSLAIHSPRE